MGFLENAGLVSGSGASTVSSAASGTSLGSILTILGIFFGIVVIGGIVFYVYYNKIRKKTFNIHINLLKDINGKPSFVQGDTARVLKLAGTNIRVLYWHKLKLYSAYPTREIGNNVYTYKINRFGELVNCDFATEEENPLEIKLQYDHRDQNYAYENMRDLINKNAMATKGNWLKENAPLLILVIMGILLAVTIFIFLRQTSLLTAQNAQIAEAFKTAASGFSTAAQNQHSGLVSAAAVNTTG